MNISREKINIAMARKNCDVSTLAVLYGVSRQRMYVILNSKSVSTSTAGKLAKILNTDVTEIIE